MCLRNLYEEIQNKLNVEIESERAKKYKELVTFKDNKEEPIHRWFTFKEGYSHKLLPTILEDLGLKGKVGSILDPFSGCGTSLLSWQNYQDINENSISYGIERNPFIEFVSKTKINWPNYNPEIFKSLYTEILNDKSIICLQDNEIPSLSTLHNPRVFSRETLLDLLQYRRKIFKHATNYSEQDLLILGWSSIVEKVSGVRKDGRALRFVDKPLVPTVSDSLQEIWSMMYEDLIKCSTTYKKQNKVKVVLGDARHATNVINDKNFTADLIIYSPPYLNNFDYTEVYKMELWLNELVKTRDDFRNQRLKTIRSHPSINFEITDHIPSDPKAINGNALRNCLIQAAEDLGKDVNKRKQIFTGYFDDMFLSLKEQYKLCKPGGYAICVVANSFHGPKDRAIPVATDLILSGLGMDVGFKVKELIICRQIRRRLKDNDLYRESIIVFQK